MKNLIANCLKRTAVAGFLSLICLTLLAGSLFLSGCSDSGEGTEIPDKPEGQKFHDVLFEKTITFSETLDKALADYGVTEEMTAPYAKILALLKSMQVSYRVHAIRYRTSAPDGKPVLASGVVYFPASVEHPKGVIEISPVNKSKGACVTEEYMTPEVLPAMSGYVCIIPDLIGCGSTSDLPISYLQHENTAVVSADLRQAAAEFLAGRYGFRMAGESILYGYSLGGSGIMALDRYYEKHPELGVKVSHVFAGGGAYEPMEVVRAQLEGGRSDYALIPNILCSLDYYYGLELDFERVFKGPLRDNYRTWCDGNMPIDRLTKLLGKDIRGYLSDDFLAGFETGEEYSRLREVLERQALHLDWVPRGQVHLYHAARDFYVPTVCGDRMNSYLRKAGASVSYRTLDCGHVEAALLMGIDFALFLTGQ